MFGLDLILRIEMKYFLTIAASDTSGGAGIQQDLRMCFLSKLWGLSVITANTAQDFYKACHHETVSFETFKYQLDTVISSFNLSAIKIGVVPCIKMAKYLNYHLKKLSIPIIFDPVLKSSSGYNFSRDSAVDIFYAITHQMGSNMIITPNIPELEYLTEKSIRSQEDINTAVKLLKAKIDCSIYIKGGHFTDKSVHETLFLNDKTYIFSFKRQRWAYSHGTGCAFSSLLAINLVIYKNDYEKAVNKSHKALVKFYKHINRNFIDKN